MAEQEPQEHQYKHSKRISLDKYNGVGNGIMELDEKIADGFMKASDMRSDIVIMQKPHERVRDYDQIGYVKVAKFLNLPHLNFWRGDTIVQTMKENETYYVAIDDQALSEKVAAQNDGTKKFDDLFIENFKEQLVNGLSSVLKRDKLLNGGKYNVSFLSSHCLNIIHNGLLTPAVLGIEVANRESMATIGTSVVTLGLMNGIYNGLNLFQVFRQHLHERLLGDKGESGIQLLDQATDVSWDDPFIKHSVPEYFMPPVPMDRMLRGEFYLARHGKDLISQPMSGEIN